MSYGYGFQSKPHSPPLLTQLIPQYWCNMQASQTMGESPRGRPAVYFALLSRRRMTISKVSLISCLVRQSLAPASKARSP